MAKSERAFLSCPIDENCEDVSILPPAPEGIDRVEYEVELHSMIQASPLIDHREGKNWVLAESSLLHEENQMA